MITSESMVETPQADGQWMRIVSNASPKTLSDWATERGRETWMGYGRAQRGRVVEGGALPNKGMPDCKGRMSISPQYRTARAT